MAFVLAGTAPASAAKAVPEVTDAQIVHLLDRISYGPAPGDIAAVRAVGLNVYIEHQLHPDSLPTSPAMEQKLAALDTLRMPIEQMTAEYELPGDKVKNMSEDERKEYNKRRNQIVEQLAEAKILRAIMSPAQLQEVMTDFWFNHFNVFAEKGLDKVFISSYERDAIRPYALGKFGDLLEATAHHPAMLFYLDNWQNTDPYSVAARGKKLGINENYAREVMELHTLGVNGGYTQQDVTTLAHILTGWGLSNGREPAQRADFFFDPRRHDFSTKELLGYNVNGGGEQEIENVLDMLARHPSTAHHIAYELAQYFVTDDPPESLVVRLADTFSSTNGDIAAVLRTLFYSDEFWEAKYSQKKFKPPFRYAVSMFRASGTTPPGDTRFIQGNIGNMGEPLYRCLTPNGYSNTNDQWLNSDALLKRIDFAQQASKFLNNGNASEVVLNAMGRTWSSTTLDAMQAEKDPRTRTALALSSPEFVYY